VEAPSIYGIYLYDMSKNTQLPVVIPQEGYLFDEPIVIGSRPEPSILFDKAPGFGLDQTLSDENAGLLHIRSVYDFDGTFNNLGATNNANSPVTSLAMMADPTQTDADHRPARFLRVIKGAYIPEGTVPDPPVDNAHYNAAFGVSRRQGMREILGYVPIEPDGSVMVKVPANVPFAISVVDQYGRRIGGRHQNWLQVKPGEILECNGCHDHNPTPPAQALPHGYSDQPTALNSGAALKLPLDPGGPFAGTTTDLDPVAVGLQEVLPNIGETMAQAWLRNLCPDGLGGIDYTAGMCKEWIPGLGIYIDPLSPAIDPVITDVWANGTIPDVIDQRYADLTTPLPASATSSYCQQVPVVIPNQTWDARCRTVINYEQHIHPLWSVNRGAQTCTSSSCHNSLNNTQVPAAQLDLSDGLSTLNGNPLHFKSYSELLVNDVERDASGLPVPGPPDPVTLLPTTIPVAASISVAGARASPNFFDRFLPGSGNVIHEGALTPAELRLLSEWVDGGAQYYNDLFDPGVP
jgi:hypothetical protein